MRTGPEPLAWARAHEQAPRSQFRGEHAVSVEETRSIPGCLCLPPISFLKAPLTSPNLIHKRYSFPASYGR